jgi:hypothetical protein
MKKFFGGKRTYNPFFFNNHVGSLYLVCTQVEVRYWAQRNHLQDYKIYAMVICMFDDDFFNDLLHPLGDNLWPAHSTYWK